MSFFEQVFLCMTKLKLTGSTFRWSIMLHWLASLWQY